MIDDFMFGITFYFDTDDDYAIALDIYDDATYLGEFITMLLQADVNFKTKEK